MSLRTPAQQGSHLPTLDEELSTELEQISELISSEQSKLLEASQSADAEAEEVQLSVDKSQPLEVSTENSEVEGHGTTLELELDE